MDRFCRQDANQNLCRWNLMGLTTQIRLCIDKGDKPLM